MRNVIPPTFLIAFLWLFLGVIQAQAEDVVVWARTSPSDIAAIQDDWETDGYWYFYAKQKHKKSMPILAYLNQDASDVLLTISRQSGIWVNKRRPATQEELAQHGNLFPLYPPQSVCGFVKVGVEDVGNAHFGHPLDARVVIRDPQGVNMRGKELKSFAIFRKQIPPQVLHGVLSEDHEDQKKQLTVPVRSSISRVAALNGCTFLAKLEEGVVRFTTGGTTEAKLPADARLIYGEEIRRLNADFWKPWLPTPDAMPGMTKEYGESLQPRLWFFYRNIFEGELK